MEHTKGKPINTSVPSIAIRFNANAEEIEELYQSEDEPVEKSNNEKTKCSAAGDPESSPLRYLPRLGKRSTSIDTSLTIQDSSPPSDPWKFFAGIKGKITKSVEDTITEIKQRNQDSEGSTKKGKLLKESKDCSLSDSDEISESSISKTCGVVSTTEGVEMSSDDETPSLEKDKKSDDAPQPQTSTSATAESSLRQRFRIIRKKKPIKEANVSIKSLANLYEINTGLKASTSEDKRLDSEENVEDIESGVEAVEDINLQHSQSTPWTSGTDSDITSTASDIKIPHRASTDEDIISNVIDQIDNLEVDEGGQVINIQQVTGGEVRRTFTDGKSHTFFAPEGFVDLRTREVEFSWFDTIYRIRHLLAFVAALLFYFWLSLPVYISGFIAGSLFAVTMAIGYQKFCSLNTSATGLTEKPFPIPTYNSQTILEIPAVKEYQPVTKFEGWMNEYPDVYNPQTYHISQTQSVYVRLQGNLLRLSHTRAKIPKRATWNEPKHKMTFTQHRIYNLLGARVCLLPEGLNKRRHWSKKYPICVTLNKDQLNFDYLSQLGQDTDGDEDKKLKQGDSDVIEDKPKPGFLRKKKVNIQPQIFSKLTEEEEDFDLESSSSRPSSPSPPDEVSLDVSEEKINEIEAEDEIENLKDVFDQEDERADEDILSLEDWSTFTPEDSPNETHLYLFGRTDREKEDWFRRFITATHRGARAVTTREGLSLGSDSQISVAESLSDTLINAARSETEYLKFMAKFQKSLKKKKNGTAIVSEETNNEVDVLWINALIGRVLFDCIRDDTFINKVKERIQRKLSSIKLPYFIEQISISELSLGSTPPLIHKASKPILDQRGLWVDLDITYDGIIILTLQTKLNLMKLKQPPSAETTVEENRQAKWQNSDVDDTAESSSEEESHFFPNPAKILDESGNPVVGLGGTSTTSKKFIKMVDKIAESKFFQAATENRYIKKAMEGVSNTDLILKVELKGLVGTLVLNIPPPPSDRVWIGFRPTPQLWLSAHPIVGERNMSFFKYLTSWIEKKLSQEFQKILVIPNMEDILIPVMSPKLPE